MLPSTGVTTLLEPPHADALHQHKEWLVAMQLSIERLLQFSCISVIIQVQKTQKETRFCKVSMAFWGTGSQGHWKTYSKHCSIRSFTQTLDQNEHAWVLNNFGNSTALLLVTISLGQFLMTDYDDRESSLILNSNFWLICAGKKQQAWPWSMKTWLSSILDHSFYFPKQSKYINILNHLPLNKFWGGWVEQHLMALNDYSPPSSVISSGPCPRSNWSQLSNHGNQSWRLQKTGLTHWRH